MLAEVSSLESAMAKLEQVAKNPTDEAAAKQVSRCTYTTSTKHANKRGLNRHYNWFASYPSTFILLSWLSTAASERVL